MVVTDDHPEWPGVRNDRVHKDPGGARTAKIGPRVAAYRNGYGMGYLAGRADGRASMSGVILAVQVAQLLLAWLMVWTLLL